MIFDFLFSKRECSHKNVPIDVDEAYCPDCGMLIVNKWYLVRCCSCNIKRHAHIEYGKIKPDTKFCPNCGNSDFYVTELDKVNFIDLKYAVIRREIKQQGSQIINQIWVEETDNSSEQKLLGTNLS